MNKKRFVNLHNHMFSIGDSISKPDDVIERLNEIGQNAIAKTDHGTLIGTPTFYSKMKEAGIKPILGMEAYLRTDINNKNPNEIARHILLLAETDEGYQNIVQMATISQQQGFYYNPNVDYKILSKYHKGIIATSACYKGDICQALFENIPREELIPSLEIPQTKYNKAIELIKLYKKIFGENNFFLEIQAVDDDFHNTIKKYIRKIGKETNTKVIATCDAHYPTQEYGEAHKILLKHQMDGFIYSNWKPSYWIKSYEEVIENGALQEEIDNTNMVADRCKAKIISSDKMLPDLNINAEEEIIYELKTQLDKIEEEYGEEIASVYSERVNHELNIMRELHSIEEIYMVWDYVKFAKRKGYFIGPGRGSAAGSLICFLLGITKVDPISYNLIFERFLNPSRKPQIDPETGKMTAGAVPDIDIDFCNDEEGDKVEEYIKNKYGEDRFVHIGAVNYYGTKQAIRNMTKYFEPEIKQKEADKLSSSIKDNYDEGNKKSMIPISWLLEKNKKIKEAYEKDSKHKKWLDTMDKLIGVPASIMRHACGVIVTPEPYRKLVPLMRTKSNDDEITYVSQYDMEELADLGIIKFDILKLASATIIKNTEKLIGKEFKINDKMKWKANEKIKLDKKMMKMFNRGDTNTIFQLSGWKGGNIAKDIKPKTISDLAIATALNRPGCLAEKIDEQYIRRVKGEEEITYPHPCLRPILEETLGLIIFQDQAIKIAYMSTDPKLKDEERWGIADKYRKILGKKKREEIDKWRQRFINGMLKNYGKDTKQWKGMTRKTAESLFERVKDFAGYGFNKCLTGNITLPASIDQKDWDIYSIEELYEAIKNNKSVHLLSLTKDNEIVVKKVKTIRNNGIRDVFTLFTNNNKIIRSCTYNHKFVTKENNHEQLNNIIKNKNKIKNIFGE